MEPSIIAIKQQGTLDGFIPNNWHKCHPINGLRAVKKSMKQQKPSLLLLCIGSSEDEQFSRDVAQYVRKGLCNMDTRMVLLRGGDVELDEADWMETYQVNACLVAEPDKDAFNKSMLNRELETYEHIINNQRQHDAETEMLMCITRFSRADENLSELLKTFSQYLAQLCHASCSLHIATKDAEHWRVDYCDKQDNTALSALKQLIVDHVVPVCLKQAADEKHPQINLLQEDTGLESITQCLSEKIGSYLTFPIVVYDHVLYLLLYFIPEDEMDQVSMKQINIINKAAEQLTILLERKQAESSLKKQYQRLKNALVELKSAREELAHNEKMASIGRMAAGIAHEINNPLSYVISNFSSMDSYLENIIQLQNMQAEFLSSIDMQQNQKAQQIKENISEFEQEADIPFILEDIRAVVSDSFNGLQRVKNIISDLKSFSHGQATELSACDIQTVVNDTLKVLQYDIEGVVTIEQSIASYEHFMSHAGLMGQVLTNLIKNSIQAMQSADTDKPTISIKAYYTDEYVEIIVRDNGPGIAEDARQKIFDPFFTTKAVGEGTGLGLSVTYNIVKKLGGQLTCHTELGQFCEFVMQFPHADETPNI